MLETLYQMYRVVATLFRLVHLLISASPWILTGLNPRQNLIYLPRSSNAHPPQSRRMAEDKEN